MFNEKHVQKSDDTFDYDETDNAADSDYDIPKTEQQQQATETTVTMRYLECIWLCTKWY